MSTVPWDGAGSLSAESSLFYLLILFILLVVFLLSPVYFPLCIMGPLLEGWSMKE